MKHSQDIHGSFGEKAIASRLVILDDAGHGFQGADRQRAVSELVAWFDERLSAEQGD